MRRLLLIALTICCGFAARAQEAKTVFTDASTLSVYGQAFTPSSGHPFRRLPQALEGVVREPLWHLGTNSAGIYVRFRSDAPSISARWTNTGNHMPHMTDCGVGGLDLYFHDGRQWSFIGSGFNWGPVSKEHEALIVGNMQPSMREYMLYLGLYDEITSLQIGVPEGYTVEQPQLDSPRSGSPIVAYGTSILQGGCASRPGMAHTNILARRFDRTVINLGFSGNALLDFEIAELMASVANPSLFILDYVPNASAEEIRTKGERFFRIIRAAHPEVPVIFIEDPRFAHCAVDEKIDEEVRKKNEAQKELFRHLKKSGEKRIWYIGSEGMTGKDSEAFVDGIHFTDLGMQRYADHISPTVRKALRYCR